MFVAPGFARAACVLKLRVNSTESGIWPFHDLYNDGSCHCYTEDDEQKNSNSIRYPHRCQICGEKHCLAQSIVGPFLTDWKRQLSVSNKEHQSRTLLYGIKSQKHAIFELGTTGGSTNLQKNHLTSSTTVSPSFTQTKHFNTKIICLLRCNGYCIFKHSVIWWNSPLSGGTSGGCEGVGEGVFSIGRSGPWELVGIGAVEGGAGASARSQRHCLCYTCIPLFGDFDTTKFWKQHKTHCLPVQLGLWVQKPSPSQVMVPLPPSWQR